MKKLLFLMALGLFSLNLSACDSDAQCYDAMVFNVEKDKKNYLD